MKILREIIENALKNRYERVTKNIAEVIDELYANIPDNKRISYGIVHTIKVLCEYISAQLQEKRELLFQMGEIVFKKSNGPKAKGAGLGLLSHCGLNDHKKAFPYFESAPGFRTWSMIWSRSWPKTGIRTLTGSPTGPAEIWSRKSP